MQSADKRPAKAPILPARGAPASTEALRRTMRDIGMPAPTPGLDRSALAAARVHSHTPAKGGGPPHGRAAAVRACYTDHMDCLDEVKWDDRGLVTAIAQEVGSGDILMVAWMNREALSQTLARGEAVYWSRSRGRLWHKGEESGHVQRVHEVLLDCDGDAILLKVTQTGHEPGIACHTGRHSCFYRQQQSGAWVEVAPVLKDPRDMYR